MGCARKLLLALFFAAPAFAQVSPTPTPTGTPRLLVTARLTKVSGHSVIACTVKNSSGKAVSSQKVSVKKSAAITGPFALWMSKKTAVNGQALFPYAQPTYTWYVRCAAAGSVSAIKTIVGTRPRPSPTATPRPTATATPIRTPTATPRPTATPTATPTPVIGSSVNIDTNWIQQNGTGPYLLGQANTTYVLQTDVTTSGTAFVIANRNVTLNLNGHTITYNNAAPLTVPNGSFEADAIGSHTVTAWNLSGAPNSQFTVAANDCYLYSPKVLNWSVVSGTTPQVIRTAGTISIPVANRTYTASVTESGLGSIGAGNLKIEVVDSVTGQLVTNWRRIDAFNWDQGDSPSFSFVPTTTNPVYIRITMTPSQSTGASVKIDRVVLTQSADYGVLATTTDMYGLNPVWSWSAYGGDGQASGYENLPPSIQAVYRNVYAPTIQGPGSITQGQSAGAYCHNIMLNGTNGPVLVNGVTTYTNGEDTIAIRAANNDSSLTDPTNSRTIRNCTVNYAGSGPIITIRASSLAAIDVTGFSSAMVEGCTITNNPQCGIRAAGAGPGIYQTIQNNTLTPNVNITNGQALSLGGNNIRCLNNTVDTSTTGSTRGIAVGDGPNANIEIGGNSIIVRENPNREYGDRGTTARALEIRCYAPNTLNNINIHDNYFEAITGAGLMQGATGARLVLVPSGSTGLTFTNDTFVAICVGTTDPGSDYYAHGIEIDHSDVDSSNPMIFNGCTFESDEGALVLGGAAGGECSINNILFQNSTLVLSSDPSAVSRTFQSYDFGEYNVNLSGIRITGSSYQNGAPSTIKFVGSGQHGVTITP